MKINITTTNESDFDEITRVWEASVRATHTFLSEDDINFFRPKIRNEYLKAVTLRVLKNEENKILGFIGVADQKIEMLFIHPDTRGMGIGKKLLKYAIDELEATLVDVNEQNPQAVGFYEHMGFKVYDRSELDGMGKPFPLLYMRL